MKIKELYVEDYKILQNFSMDFDSQLTVLIGENGSGKSTIVEITAKIFYDLYSHLVLGKTKKPDVVFEVRYEIEYETEKYEVYITSNKDAKEYYEVNITKDNGKSKKYSKAEINKDFVNGYKDILPRNVVMYYSGISTMLKNKFTKFQNEFISSSLDGDIKIEQPFFYFLPDNFSTILIGLLSYQYGDVPETLKNQFGISEFKEIKITVKKPRWAKPKSKVDDFWGAKGDLSIFLQKLSETCNNEVITENSASFVFKTKEELEKIWSSYGEEKKLFEYLTTLQANDLIEKIDIVLIQNSKEISFKRLSEGEKQILTVFGLRELLITGNTLFLLDEPDTYLHPEWQRDFIKSIIDIEDAKTNYLITTHSPNLISGLNKKQLKIIENVDNKTNIREFSFNPFGKPVDMILTDHFGLKGLRFKDIDAKIRELQQMLIEENYDTGEFESLFTELQNEIGNDDIDLLSIKLEKIKREKVNAKD
ncbi:MAG: AAA family ATPase [Candidatus Anammoxibacter sp.]